MEGFPKSKKVRKPQFVVVTLSNKQNLVEIRPNKKTSMFWVTGLKCLGRVGTHIFFNYFFFLEKNIIL